MRISLSLAVLPLILLSGCWTANPPGAVQVPPSTSGVVPLSAQSQPSAPPAASGFPRAAAIPAGEATGIWNQQQVETWARDGLQAVELKLTPEGRGNYRGTARDAAGHELQVVVKQVSGGAKCTFEGPGRSGSFAFGNSVEITTSAASPASAPAAIPDSAVAGKIHGRDFAIEKVVFENGVLTLRQGKDHFPDLALDVMMFIRQGEPLAGKQVKVTPGQSTGIPLLRLQWREAGKGLPETENFPGNYTLVLEFGPLDGNKVAGKIFVALPDQAKSTLSEKFDVEGAK